MPFKIVAHRGVTARAPGDTVAAFRAALGLGVDAVELDVRLSRDLVPIVHHNWYLDQGVQAPVPIFMRTADQLRREKATEARADLSLSEPIPTLAEVVEEFAGKLALEIELKGPEPEGPAAVASVLAPFRAAWSDFEITSSQPSLLAAVRERCPGIATALLFPPSEPWMRLDVVAYAALHYARQAHADAVHLHPRQLTDDVATTIRAGGIEIHAHSVNDEGALTLAAQLGVNWVCTDAPERALLFRRERSSRAL